jgi:hypothetical protein
MSTPTADTSLMAEPKRSRGRPPKDVKLVRYAVLWLAPDVAEALSAECGSAKRAAVVREFVIEGLRARGRLRDGELLE